MKLFNTTFYKKDLYIILFLLHIFFISNTSAATLSLYPEINKQSAGLESYAMNIFCTETVQKKYIKAVSGSGVFLSNPSDTKGVVLTNAHVARHLLDKNKKCVGRTGSPAVATHKLTLRYIPSFWLRSNGQYIIGDPNKESTGEFDFAVIEVQKLPSTVKKVSTIYDVLKPSLQFQLKDYAENSTLPYAQGSIVSYPAQKTLSKNIYNPLYIKKDSIRVQEVYRSPTHNESDSLLDTTGSTQVDHGSSGGMVVLEGFSNNLVGLSSVLIKDNIPQIVRVVTLRHVFSVIDRDLGLINTNQADVFLQILKSAQEKRLSDESLMNIFKNDKLTSLLEQQTRDTLYGLGIIKK